MRKSKMHKTIDNIDKDLKNFQLILVLIVDKYEIEKLMIRLKNPKIKTKKILILSNVDISFTDSFYTYRRISDEERDTIMRIYYMYDFSDRFQIISDNPQYGGLLNYVKTGFMTWEDIFEILFVL